MKNLPLIRGHKRLALQRIGWARRGDVAGCVAGSCHEVGQKCSELRHSLWRHDNAAEAGPAVEVGVRWATNFL